MKTLYQKLSILLNNITIESGYLAREKIAYNDDEATAFLKGKVDNETNAEITIKLSPIPKY
jgi:hypothetical protein